MIPTSPWSGRRRAYGPRCASPPTFVCYELPQPDHYSRSGTPSSDEEAHSVDGESSSDSNSNSDDDEFANDIASSAGGSMIATNRSAPVPQQHSFTNGGDTAMSPESDTDEIEDAQDKRRLHEKREGKRKEVTSEVGPPQGSRSPESAGNHGQIDVTIKHKKHQRSKKRSRVHELGPPVRPILTIRSSQGFVWNQDLFVPAYIKERYIASSPPSSLTSLYGTPPSVKGTLSNNNFFSSSNGTDYEVECVEIRVVEGELDGLLPRAR